jgi:soluble lytic murein transglycosylase-like protein
MHLVAQPLSAALFAIALAGCVATQTASVGGTNKAREPDSAEATEVQAAAHFPEAARYEDLIARYAAENGVPLPLAHAVVEKESGYNAKARGRGTVGLMQIMPATARGIGYRGTTEQLYDPATNLEWGMKYLGGAYKLGGGDTCGAALRYQGGHRATRSSAMTRRYCAELKAIMARNGGS